MVAFDVINEFSMLIKLSNFSIFCEFESKNVNPLFFKSTILSTEVVLPLFVNSRFSPFTFTEYLLPYESTAVLTSLNCPMFLTRLC